MLSKQRFFFGFISLIALIPLEAMARSSALRGQSADSSVVVEDVARANPAHRGQGGAPWCFAFAEEQVLKDTLCSGPSCRQNADQWHISIFDIVRHHRDNKNRGDREAEFGTKDQTLILFSGAAVTFPYLTESNAILRHSQCTLEKPLFLINRLRSFNPLGLNFYEQLKFLYELGKTEFGINFKEMASNFESDAVNFPSKSPWLAQYFNNLVVALNQTNADTIKYRLRATIDILNLLARQSSTHQEFIEKVLDYSTCNETVRLPSRKMERKRLSDEGTVSSTLVNLLKQQKSVYLGVCADILEDPSATLSSGCGGHAVVAKELKGDKVLIVDSAFKFEPKNGLNPDGSAWVPLNIVAQAVSSYGKFVETIQEKYFSDLNQAEQDLLIEDLSSQKKHIQEALTIGQNFIDSITANWKGVKDARLFKALFLSAFYFNSINPSAEQSRYVKELNLVAIEAFESLEFRTMDDLHKLKEAIAKYQIHYNRSFTIDLHRKSRNWFSQYNTNDNIVWFE